MKKPVKLGIIGFVVLILIVGGVYYTMMPVPVRMVEVRARVAELSFMEQGIVTADNTIQVFSAVQGEITGIYVTEGQEVEEGDVLVKVDDTALRLQLQQARSGVRSLEAQMAGIRAEDEAMRQNLISARNSLQGELMAINAQAAQSDLLYFSQQTSQSQQIRIQQVLIGQHENELDRARLNYERFEFLYQSGLVALVELEAASASVLAAESQLEAARGQAVIIAAGVPQGSEHFYGLRVAVNAQIAGINQQLAQDSISSATAHFEAMIDAELANVAGLERLIENSAVTAPAGGIVTALYAQGTNIISAAAPVAEITVPGSMAINVYVSTQDIGSIRAGDAVGLTLRRRMEDAEFTGVVTEIDSAAVVRLTALGVEERKVSVKVEPQIPEGVEMVLGHALDVTFFVFREESRIIVPRTAVFRENGQDMVWAVRGGDAGKVEPVPVVTGLELRTEVIIVSGLDEGDYVVFDANNPDIKAGVRVNNVQ